MTKVALHQPTRQSMVGIVVMFFQNLRRAINFMLAVIVVTYGRDFTFLGMGLYELGAVIAVILLIASVLQWRNFYFYVKNEQFIVERGVFSKDRTNVPFERIQTVNTTQNVIQQMLGVVGLKIDTAGSNLKELEVGALQGDYAHELQEYLMQQKKEKAGDSEDGDEEMAEQSPDLGKPLVHLRTAELLKVGLTENHLRSGVVLFAIVNGYLWQYEEFLLQPFEPFIERQANQVLAQGLLLVPFAVVAFIVIAVIFSLVQTFLRYYDLRFYLNKRGLVLQSGLLRRNEFQVPANKIQYLKWKSNPLRYLVRFRTLVVRQAGSEDTGDASTVTVPGAPNRSILRVVRHFYPSDYMRSRTQIGSNRLLFIQRMVWLGVIPFALASALVTYNELSPYFYLLPALYLILCYPIFDRYQKSVKLAVNPVGIRLKKGWIFPGTTLMEFYKLQNVKLSQSIFQKRRGLMSLAFHTAAGSEVMPHLPESFARELYDYCLYRIEVSDKSWM